MSIQSTIEAAANVGPYPVYAIGSQYFVGPWAFSADGNFLGPYGLDLVNSHFVGPYPWWQDASGNYWMGPYAVK
jgi:hypothetical protein